MIDKLLLSEKKVSTNGAKRILNVHQIKYLSTYFHNTENRKLCKTLCMSETALHRFARELGLKKSEKGMKSIMHRTAKIIKKKCEANGYYDSLRGKQPSENCMNGYKTWRDKGNDPLRNLKINNPRRYKEICKKRSERRKRLIAEEKRRCYLGLAPKTKFGEIVTRSVFDRSQICFRYNMKRKGYILGDERPRMGERYKIYYDSETIRVPKSEKNAVNYGFEICKLP